MEMTWFILREPNRVPERKGPFAADQVKGFLRELMDVRPTAFISVLTVHADGPHVQDGPECLEMMDARYRAAAARHRANTKAAFAASK
jgi:hypothetical protein